MTLLPRRREVELMDGPDLAAAAHHAALEGLARINRWSAARSTLAGPVLAEARRAADEGRRPSLLDVACGAGDVPVSLWCAARDAKLPLDVTAIDRSSEAITHTLERAARAGAPLTALVRDACDGQPLPQADVVTCSLFLHHLDAHEAAALLARMAAAARRLLLVADLRRSLTGLLLALSVPRLLSRSAVVHQDAPASARAAWSPVELSALAQRAGLPTASVQTRFPQRMLLTWTRP